MTLDSGKFLKYKAKGRYFDGYGSAIHVMKECPTRYNVGFGMPIGSPFLHRINKVSAVLTPKIIRMTDAGSWLIIYFFDLWPQLISRFQSSGLIDKWLNDIYHEAALKIPNKEKKRKWDRALSLDNMKLLYIIFFCGHFSAFLTLLVEKAITEYRARKGELLLLRLVRKISIISSPTKTPSFLITDTQESKNVMSSETDLEKCGKKKNGPTLQEENDKMHRLQPPDPDAVMPFDDEQDEWGKWLTKLVSKVRNIQYYTNLYKQIVGLCP